MEVTHARCTFRHCNHIPFLALWISPVDLRTRASRSGIRRVIKNFHKPKSNLIFFLPFYLPSFHPLESRLVGLLMPLFLSFTKNSPLTYTSISWLMLTNLSTAVSYPFLLLSMLATCSTPLTMVILDHVSVYKLWSFRSRNKWAVLCTDP
jgi:hypothetical protein